MVEGCERRTVLWCSSVQRESRNNLCRRSRHTARKENRVFEPVASPRYAADNLHFGADD